jgi:D-glycero-D-manno-heptose 1,7-bisphosphate phosphatase
MPAPPRGPLAPLPPRPAVFLDRDDTLIACNAITPDGDLFDPALVRLLPGVSEALASLRAAGFFLGVVTNQGAVARGKCSIADVEAVHARLRALLPGLIDDIRFCPYHPNGSVPAYTREHPWRKPAPGMILDLAHAHSLDLARSWLIGDAPRDAAAGKAAGCRTILITADAASPDTADSIAPTIADAARVILSSQAPHP